MDAIIKPAHDETKEYTMTPQQVELVQAWTEAYATLAGFVISEAYPKAQAAE